MVASIFYNTSQINPSEHEILYKVLRCPNPVWQVNLLISLRLLARVCPHYSLRIRRRSDLYIYTFFFPTICIGRAGVDSTNIIQSKKKTWYVERATIWSAHMWSCEYDDALYLLGNHQPVGRQTNVLAAIQQRKSWMGAWSLAFAMQHYLNQNISPHWQTPTEPRYDRLTEYVCHMWVIW